MVSTVSPWRADAKTWTDGDTLGTSGPLGALRGSKGTSGVSNSIPSLSITATTA